MNAMMVAYALTDSELDFVAGGRPDAGADGGGDAGAGPDAKPDAGAPVQTKKPDGGAEEGKKKDDKSKDDKNVTIKLEGKVKKEGGKAVGWEAGASVEVKF
jgi:hypothetical protein